MKLTIISPLAVHNSACFGRSGLGYKQGLGDEGGGMRG